MLATRPTGGCQTAPAPRRCCAAPDSRSPTTPKPRSTSAAALRPPRAAQSIPHGDGMIEAAMLWNEPNNKSHWDPALDPDWALFAEHVIRAGQAIREINPAMTRVLGGMSPIDPHWLRRMDAHGALRAVDAVAVHGFPLDWNLWPLVAWPDKIAEIKAVTEKPVWVTEVGVSSFGAEEVQAFGLERTAALLKDVAPRIFWYSLFDLPKSWGAETRHREAEGSS